MSLLMVFVVYDNLNSLKVKSKYINSCVDKRWRRVYHQWRAGPISGLLLAAQRWTPTRSMRSTSRRTLPKLNA